MEVFQNLVLLPDDGIGSVKPGEINKGETEISDQYDNKTRIFLD